jgi:hypothetical protein
MALDPTSTERGAVPDQPAGGVATSAPSETPGSDPSPSACVFLADAAEGARSGARCLAGERPIDLADLQVALVCRTDLHVDCPRFLAATRRGRRAPRPQTPAVEGPDRGRASGVGPTERPRVVPLAASVAAVPRARLAASVGLGFAVVVAAVATLRPGGLSIAALQATLPASPSGSPSRPPQSPSPSPTASPSPGPVAPSPSPSPVPEDRPSPPPATPSVSPGPSLSDRYALLEPCPDRPDCYVYTVRRGDNLWSIGNYFGVPLATIYELNPWARSTGLRAGQKLVLPPPTR